MPALGDAARAVCRDMPAEADKHALANGSKLLEIWKVNYQRFQSSASKPVLALLSEQKSKLQLFSPANLQLIEQIQF